MNGSSISRCCLKDNSNQMISQECPSLSEYMNGNSCLCNPNREQIISMSTHMDHHCDPGHILKWTSPSLFTILAPFLDLAFLSLGNVLNHSTIFKFSFFLSTTIIYTTNCICPFCNASHVSLSFFFFHCCHFGQAFTRQYCVLAHNGDDSTDSGGGPPIFRFELCSLLCAFD